MASGFQATRGLALVAIRKSKHVPRASCPWGSNPRREPGRAVSPVGGAGLDSQPEQSLAVNWPRARLEGNPMNTNRPSVVGVAAVLAALVAVLVAACTSSPGSAQPGGSRATGPASSGAPVSCDHRATATATRVGLSPEGHAIAPAFPATTNQALLAREQTLKRVIAAGNQVANKPYRLGGGHGPFTDGVDTAYDASGAVDWALHGAGLLSEPLTSGELIAAVGVQTGKPMTALMPGTGQWMTIWANETNVFLEIGSVTLYTSASYLDPCALPGSGPRWTTVPISAAGYQPLHSPGL
jgi:hypothetical protein